MFPVGTVVCSQAGRDSGKLLVVTGCEENFVCVCDGKERPLDNPKRKNPKHISPTDKVIGEAEMKSDRALRRALAQLKER